MFSFNSWHPEYAIKKQSLTSRSLFLILPVPAQSSRAFSVEILYSPVFALQYKSSATKQY